MNSLACCRNRNDVASCTKREKWEGGEYFSTKF